MREEITLMKSAIQCVAGSTTSGRLMFSFVQSSKKASGAKAADFAYRAPVSKEFSAKEPKFEESGFTIPKPQKEVKDISIPTFLKRN